MMAQAEVIPPLRGWHGSAELHPYFVCDVFTSEPLQGNQLGVFTDGRPFSPAQMQRLAKEMNFAETVFLLPPQDGGDARLRIFTPGAELPFAGHPVLGTAFVVGTALGTDAVTLETAAGLVPIILERSGDRITFGRMSQLIPVWEQFDRERSDTLAMTDHACPVWGAVSPLRVPAVLCCLGGTHLPSTRAAWHQRTTRSHPERMKARR